MTTSGKAFADGTVGRIVSSNKTAAAPLRRGGDKRAQTYGLRLFIAGDGMFCKEEKKMADCRMVKFTNGGGGAAPCMSRLHKSVPGGTNNIV